MFLRVSQRTRVSQHGGLAIGKLMCACMWFCGSDCPPEIT